MSTTPAFVEAYRPATRAERAVVRMALEAAGVPDCVKDECAGMGARAAAGADELGVMTRFDQADAAGEAIAEAPA